MLKVWEASAQNRAEDSDCYGNESGEGGLKSSVAFFTPILRAYISQDGTVSIVGTVLMAARAS